MDAAVKELLELLDGLPLALAQAATYCRESGINIASYLELYKQQWDALMSHDANSDRTLIDYDQKSIATAWTLSFKEIEAKSQTAANLLRLWSFISNKDFWHDLLSSPFKCNRKRPDWLTEIADNKIKFLDTMRLLLRYSMIEVQDSEQQSYSIHPVVHRWNAHIQDTSDKKEYLQLAIAMIRSSAPPERTSYYWALRRRLIPHAESCFWWIEAVCAPGRDVDDLTLYGSIYELGNLFYHLDQLSEAEILFKRLLPKLEDKIGPDAPIVLRMVHSLGRIHLRQGQFNDAEVMFQRALRVSEKVYGPDHPDTLASVTFLSFLQLQQDQFSEAEVMFQRAHRVYEKVYGPDHPDTLASVTFSSFLQLQRGQSNDSEVMLQRALRVYEKVYGPDHPYTLATVMCLGSLYLKRGQFNDAEVMLQRALRGYEKVHGPDHPDTLATVMCLGSLYLKRGQFNDAEVMLQRALRGYEKVHGPDHRRTIWIAERLKELCTHRSKLLEDKMRRDESFGRRVYEILRELVIRIGIAP